MIGLQDEKPEIQKFLDEYQEKFWLLQKEAKEIFTTCYGNFPACNPEDYYVEMEATVGALRTLSAINAKVEEIQKQRRSCRIDFDHFNKGESEGLNRFGAFGDKITEIINCAKNWDNEAIQSAKRIYERIQKCPFGEQENRCSNALFFQRAVLELLEWLFVNELQRMDLSEIEDGSQRRDGGFEVTDEFDTEKRCGFPFKHLFIECKNYRKPSYHDLMQVFSYTLHCQESKIFAVPMSVLVSRGNPSPESATWRLRSLIFNRRVEDEQRLILFLDERDLGKMIEYKQSGGDPARLLSEKVEELKKWNIKRGPI